MTEEMDPFLFNEAHHYHQVAGYPMLYLHNGEGEVGGTKYSGEATLLMENQYTYTHDISVNVEKT